MKKLALTFLLLLFAPAVARAQVFWDFPSPDLTLAQGYLYKLYVTAPGSTVITGTVALDPVVCSATADTSMTVACQAPVTQAVTIGATVVGAKSTLTAIDKVNGLESAPSTPFIMQGCADPTNVKLNVGSWASPVQVQGLGQVFYNLRQSKTDVVSITVMFNGIVQDKLTGTRLNNVAGSYFVANVPPGSYQLSVSASDANGCTDGGVTRPMTVVVQ